MKKIEKFKVNYNTKKGDCCPECSANWDGGDILEHFLEAKFNPLHKQHSHYKDKTLDEIKKVAFNYGWTDENPKRFGNVIGIELAYNDPRHYDGVSFWKCPTCEVAWDRFTGERTEEFMTQVNKVVERKLNADGNIIPEQRIEDDEPERQCIYRSLTTPDGTVLISYHGHDYVTHIDKNGEEYMLDGGPNKNYRTSINNIEGVITEVYLDEGHDKIRDFVHRGGRGKNRDQPLTWVPVSKMNDNWVRATITYNDERGMGHGWFNKVLKDEIIYREEHGIKILEEDEETV